MLPIDGVLKAGAKEILMETDSDGNERINRINYEICVLAFWHRNTGRKS
ncbi:MAG: hypothetical protein QNJ72_15895 [Pleurocapsa sp. MO_226.B13]|nr:hypothetical protein [Pleurocapsa sp. MO_226.B13]